MKKILLLFFCALPFIGVSQTLNLPVRSKTALSGSQFEATIASSSLSLTNRENMIYAQILKGNVPDFYRKLDTVNVSVTVKSVKQSVTYYVAPDYVTIGCDSDYYLCPMSPMLATKIGTLTGTTLCTRRMVGEVWSAAKVKLSPQTLPPGPLMSTVPFFYHHDSLVDSLRDTFLPAHPLGQLVSGDEKDVVISNLIYSIANRVIIFGWYYTSGTYIQPMTNVHADTYMDYSHGIRLVQNNCWLNDTTPTTIQSILESSAEDTLLSDEGVIAQPWYPYGITQKTPTSFAVLKNSPTSLKVIVKNDDSVTHYNIYTSTDGINYSEMVRVPKSNLVIPGLQTDKLYFVKIMAYDSLSGTTSAMSEVLAAVPTSRNDSTLLVSGFERAIAGNTYNFTIQHGSALYNNNRFAESCTHRAITDKLVSLQNYAATDWILGEESTADSSFTPNEQTYITTYLQKGGYLFTSGSEIGYDLYQFGSLADKAFYSNYLKARFISDAPDSKASTYYSSMVNPIATSIFDNNDTVDFDNGTHGTYNVNYPDAIAPINGAEADLHYNTLDTEYACIHYAGIFTGGVKTGKLVYMAYPFETIYPSTTRDTIMKDILIFFFGKKSMLTGIDEAIVNQNQVIVYPNPNNGVFTIKFSQPLQSQVNIRVFDLSGRLVKEETMQEEQKQIRCSDLSTGTYLVQLYSNDILLGVSRVVIVN
ncbi:MAG TPA: T9SS type A sorting domain-containing protein [Bacteroidia bacterium]|nr:T9SS type A sorting domain-containing protein [Bacteroidia bacterium]